MSICRVKQGSGKSNGPAVISINLWQIQRQQHNKYRYNEGKGASGI